MTQISRSIIFLLGICLCSGLGSAELPDLGDPSISVISRAEERNLGRQFMLNARRQLNYIDDPELRDYIQTLGQKLLGNSDAPGEAIHFYLVDNPELNAFAVPGAHITIHTGLILATESESELAAVLSHEIAHISQRHLPRMIARSENQSLPATAAMIAAVLLGGQAGAAALTATNAAILEDRLRFNRDFEREADALGIKTLARSQFDPTAMAAFFNRLDQLTRLQNSNIPEFLRTHPLSSNRIAESEARSNDYPKPTVVDEAAFNRIRAKIRALFSTRSNESVRQFAANLTQGGYRDESSERYGYALALARVGQFAEASREINFVLEQNPRNPAYAIAAANIEMQAGRHEAAIKLYEQVLGQFPDYAPGWEYYSEALIRLREPAKAKPILRRQLRQYPDDPYLYRLLARAEGELGQQAPSYQALAEFHYLNGDIKKAVRQLELAKQNAGDSAYLQSSIDARLDQFQAELKTLKDIE